MQQELELLSYLIEENKEKDCLGNVVKSFGDTCNWEEMCGEGK
jgi:hypothetical protein